MGISPILVCVGFLAGIAAHGFFPFTRVGAAYLALMFSIGLGVFWLAMRHRALFIFWLCLFLGFWRFDASLPSPAWEASLLFPSVRIQGTVGKKLSSWTVVDGKFVVRGLSVPLGSSVQVTCRMNRIPATPGFDRRLWMARQGIWFECLPSEWQVLYPPSFWDPIPHFLSVRAWFSSRVRSRFPPDQAELLIGMLYGSPNFSPEELDAFRRAGLMHLVAVSGSNISIVVTAVFFVFLRSGLRRRPAFWATSLCILFYCTFVGFGASVVRAAVMAWLGLFGRDRGKLVHGPVLLLVCAVFMNLWNPWQLLFDPGFILSFLAMIGLMTCAEAFQALLFWVPKRFGLRETLAMTCAATAWTAPYSAFAFGQWSFAGLFTNVVAVPLVPWVMGSGACASILPDSFLELPCHAAAFGFLRVIHGVAALAVQIPFLSGTIPFSLFGMFFTYAILAFMAWRLRHLSTCIT